jgi:hypothetical protein
MDIQELLRNYRPIQLQPQQQRDAQPKGGFQPTALISEAGGIGGAVAGAKLGAGAGLLGGPLGAAVGGVLGAGIGGFLGGTGGKLAENKIRDDEFRPGEALQEGALSGVFGAGPLRLGKITAGAIKGGRAGATQQLGKSLIGGAGGRLEKGGQQLLVSQANVPRGMARQMDLPDVFASLNRYGLRNLDEIADIGQRITGNSGLMSTGVRKAVGKAGGVDTRGFQEIAEAIIENNGVLLSDTVKNNILKTAFSGLRKTAGGGRGSLSPTAQPLDVFDVVKSFESKAGSIGRGKPAALLSSDEASTKQIYKLLADEMRDRLFSAQGIDAALPGVKSALAKQVRELAKTTNKKGLNKLASDIEGAKSIQELRSLQAPFVRGGMVASETAIAQGAAGASLAGAPKGLGRLGNPLRAAEIPLQAANAPAGGAMIGLGQRLQSQVPRQLSPVRAGVGAGIGSSMVSETGQPQDLESVLMDQQMGMQPQMGGQMGIGGDMQGLGGMQGMQPQSMNPYPRENLIYDLQRDPANAQAYIQQYAMLEEIFGGQQEQLTPERAQYLQTTMTSGATVLDDATRALDIVRSGAPAAGTIPSRFGFIRESPAGQLRDLVNSVKANIGIDTLLSIKQSGAGLGQVPQSQLEELQRVLGELDPGMNAPQLERNLARIQSIYGDIVQNLQAELNQGGGFAPQYAQNIGLEQALIGGMR